MSAPQSIEATRTCTQHEWTEVVYRPAYTGNECPFCEVVAEAERKVGELEERIETLEGGDDSSGPKRDPWEVLHQLGDAVTTMRDAMVKFADAAAPAAPEAPPARTPRKKAATRKKRGVAS